MTYFRELPDLEYQSPFADRLGSDDYVRVKNLFRRVKLRDDLQNVFTVFNKYEIPEGYRPETVALELYGKVDLDWVVIISAGIVRIRDEWPLSERDLYRYCLEKYGSEGELNEIKFYETLKVVDNNGNIILPAGKVVDSDYNIPDPKNPYQMLVPNPVTGVSNYEYEVRKNNQKRTIYVLRKSYLQQFLNDMRNIMSYEKSSQYINSKLIRTENTRITLP